MHILFECEDESLLCAMEALHDPLPGAHQMHLRMSSWEFLDFLLRTERVLPTLARFTRMLYDLTDTTPALLLRDDSELGADVSVVLGTPSLSAALFVIRFSSIHACAPGRMLLVGSSPAR